MEWGIQVQAFIVLVCGREPVRQLPDSRFSTLWAVFVQQRVKERKRITVTLGNYQSSFFNLQS
jgi:hypothetical protein